jgi:lambda family phage minor tail protein L
MPLHMSVATVIEKNRIASPVAFVPLLEIDVTDPKTGAYLETIYLARNNENVEYNGHTYTAAAFDFDAKVEDNNQPTVTVMTRDYTRAIQARVQAYGGGVGFTVRLIIVNSGNITQPPEIVETFSVIQTSAKNYDITFTLGTENPLTRRFPFRRQFRDRCQWRYKGPECGYNGPLPSCDFTLFGINGCAAHNNDPRFGGFPGIGISTTGI